MKFLLFSACIFLLFMRCGDHKHPEKHGHSHSDIEKFQNSNYYDNVTLIKDVIYAHNDTTQQVMDIYRQSTLTGEPYWVQLDTVPRPTLIHIHGGGWLAGDKADNPYIFADYLQKGWNVFNLNYRMGPGTAPQAAEDVICALRYIVDNKEKYAVDTDRIFTTGGSAGGHLALVVGLAPSSKKSFACDVSDIKIRGIINFYGITDIAENDKALKDLGNPNNYTITWVGDMNRMSEVSEKYSPIFWLTDDSPPILSIHGAKDNVVPYTQGKSLHERAEQLNIRNKLVTIEHGNHGGFGDESYDRIQKETWKFIMRTMD